MLPDDQGMTRNESTLIGMVTAESQFSEPSILKPSLHAKHNSISKSRNLSKRQVKITKEVEEQLICRICLGEEEENNAMLCPCKCAGSMGAIHTLCLREWLQSKRQTFKGKRVTSYFWRLLECELCKEPFERKMRSALFNILEFDLPCN